MVEYTSVIVKDKWKVISSLRKFIHAYKTVILTTIFLSVIADIVFIVGGSDFMIYGILILYIVSILFYRLSSRTTFRLSLILLGVMFLEFIFSGTSQKTEKAAVWIFFFLAVGIIQQFREK